MIQHSCYLSTIFGENSTLKNTVRMCEDYLRGVDGYTHIATRGFSGLVVGSPLAITLNKGLIFCRKHTNHSHATTLVEGCPLREPFKYIIVDDFICTGETVVRIIEHIEDYNSKALCVGVLQYDESQVPHFGLQQLSEIHRLKISEFREQNERY